MPRLTPESDVVAHLMELVDRSLVRVHAADRAGEADRFDLLLPIREFAAERLVELEPDGRTLDRHADHFLRAADLDRDGTRDDRSALATTIEEEWHNIRAALDRLHEQGRTAAEIAVSPMLGRCLQYLGREGTAVSLLRHAAEHLDPEDSSDTAVSVLVHLADLEFGADRAVAAVPTLVRAHRLLGRNESPAVTVHLAAVNTLMQDPCQADPALLDRAYGLVTAMGERGNALPRWYVTDLWVLAAICVEDRRADRLQAQLLASSSGREHLRLRSGIGANLSWVGRAAEAEQLLAVFADEAVRGAAYPVDRILPLMVLADMRIAAGRASEAGSVLDAAAADLAAFDQPFEHAMIRVQRAAIDRAAGDLDRAAERLETLLASQDADGVEGGVAFAQWLLAVVERERGRPDAATARLRLAWEVARTGPDEHLTVRCLLERSIQGVRAAPHRALQDLAMATSPSPHEWVHFDVHYDTAAIRRALEVELGVAAVEAAMGEAADLDLRVPAWDGAD